MKPKLVVALGGTAAASVFGRPVQVLKERGKATASADGSLAMATFHPAYLLRLPDEVARRAAFRDFVNDLKLAKNTSARSSGVHTNGAN